MIGLLTTSALSSTGICAMTHRYIYYDPLVFLPWPIGIYAMTHWCMCQDSMIYVPGLIDTCAKRKLSVCCVPLCWVRTALICVPRPIDMCAMPHWCMCHDSLIYVQGLIDICAELSVCCVFLCRVPIPLSFHARNHTLPQTLLAHDINKHV